MVDWPSSTALPQNMLVDGYSHAVGDNLLRSEMDNGPAKVRRRGSAAPRHVVGRIFVSATQRTAFWTFYNTTTLSGSLRFTWTDQSDGTTSAEYRFVSPPIETPVDDDDRWIIDMELEIMP